jgi:hypothetical protein
LEFTVHKVRTAGTNAAIAVELRGASDIVIRDRDGNILFAVDQSARTTTVGKQRRQRASAPPTAERALPDGCEGAFSPYAEQGSRSWPVRVERLPRR